MATNEKLAIDVMEVLIKIRQLHDLLEQALEDVTTVPEADGILALINHNRGSETLALGIKHRNLPHRGTHFRRRRDPR